MVMINTAPLSSGIWDNVEYTRHMIPDQMVRCTCDYAFTRTYFFKVSSLLAVDLRPNGDIGPSPRSHHLTTSPHVPFSPFVLSLVSFFCSIFCAYHTPQACLCPPL